LAIGKIKIQVARPPRAKALGLSPRELETLLHLAGGFSGKEIARYMNVSLNTVLTYKFRIGVKFGASSKADLIGHLVAHCLEQESALVAQRDGY